MNRKNLRVFCFLSLFVLTLELGASHLQFPDKRGRIIDSSEDHCTRIINEDVPSEATAEMQFLVKGTPSACFQVITSFDTYPKFMPNVTNVDATKRDDGNFICKFNLKIALVKVDYTLIMYPSQKADTFNLKWEYVEGDLKNTSGSWNITSSSNRDGYSVVRYRVSIDPGVAMPGWIRKKLLLKSLPDIMKGVREQVAAYPPR